MKFSDILNAVRDVFKPKPLISPLVEGDLPNQEPPVGNEKWRVDENGNTVPRFAKVQQPAQEAPVIPSDNPRNPNWNTWKKINPKGFQELLSGAKQASMKHGVPAGLLMDVSGLETSGGTQLDPPAGHTARGYFMFNQPTINDPYLPANVPANFDPMSATDSADLAAQLIRKGQLSRWAVANTPGAGGNKLTDFYNNDELSQFLR